MCEDKQTNNNFSGKEEEGIAQNLAQGIINDLDIEHIGSFNQLL